MVGMEKSLGRCTLAELPNLPGVSPLPHPAADPESVPPAVCGAFAARLCGRADPMHLGEIGRAHV